MNFKFHFVIEFYERALNGRWPAIAHSFYYFTTSGLSKLPYVGKVKESHKLHIYI